MNEFRRALFTIPDPASAPWFYQLPILWARYDPDAARALEPAMMRRVQCDQAFAAQLIGAYVGNYPGPTHRALADLRRQLGA